MADPPTILALRDALPTVRHARMAFRMLQSELGDAAYVETANDGQRLALYRREGRRGAIVPWTLARLSNEGRLSTVIMLTEAPEPEPPPGEAPKLRGLGAGEICFRDGTDHLTVTYGDDGRVRDLAVDTDRSLTGIVAALARRTASQASLVADFIAGVDVGRHGPGRLHLPTPGPTVAGYWTKGRAAVRDALFFDRIPWDARWAVADGYIGTALAWGATREAALAAWREVVARVRPVPPPLARPLPPPPPPPGVVSIRGARADLPRPDPTPENTPAAIVELAPPPDGPPPRGRWVRLLGTFGGTTHAMRWDEPDGFGFDLVSEDLVHCVDPDRLDAQLDSVPTPPPPPVRPPGEPCVCIYRVEDGAFAYSGGNQGAGYDPGGFDGDELRGRVLRQRRS